MKDSSFPDKHYFFLLVLSSCFSVRSLFSPFLSPLTNIQPKKKNKKKLLTLLQRPTAHNANTDACTHSAFSLLRNMRAGSNSQAGKAVVDSNLDLAGLGYFYFPKSHREEKWREVSARVGGVGWWGAKILLQMSDNDR